LGGYRAPFESSRNAGVQEARSARALGQYFGRPTAPELLLQLDHLGTLYSAATAALITVSLWAATQYAAVSLGFHPALGNSWFSLLGYPVYAP
jgi:hypothetical protein